MDHVITSYSIHYTKLYDERTLKLVSEDGKLARELAGWKRKVIAGWDQIEVVGMEIPDIAKKELGIGENYQIHVEIDLKQLAEIDVNLEMVITESKDEGQASVVHIEDFKVMKKEGTKVLYNS